ncbi:uncharacterized protein [Symphalangus syndactylus]|uniref:uncharacterized protein n=1 Tax=Symphalangus syndactylus TaxID=9590 RepID=UPI003004507A
MATPGGEHLQSRGAAAAPKHRTRGRDPGVLACPAPACHLEKVGVLEASFCPGTRSPLLLQGISWGPPRREPPPPPPLSGFEQKLRFPSVLVSLSRARPQGLGSVPRSPSAFKGRDARRKLKICGENFSLQNKLDPIRCLPCCQQPSEAPSQLGKDQAAGVTGRWGLGRSQAPLWVGARPLSIGPPAKHGAGVRGLNTDPFSSVQTPPASRTSQDKGNVPASTNRCPEQEPLAPHRRTSCLKLRTQAGAAKNPTHPAFEATSPAPTRPYFTSREAAQ